MALPFSAAFRTLVHPGEAFLEAEPSLGRALARMALVWMPLAVLQALATIGRALAAYQSLRVQGLPAWLGTGLGLDPAEAATLLRDLPAAPAFGSLVPWVLGLVPLGVLGTWLHHAVWDHAGLWMLGGLRARRGFRTSLVAEAEALRVTALGSLAGFLAFLPWAGPLLSLPLALLEGYLWLFRGVALARRHGCEVWRGVAATVIHAGLLAGFAGGLILVILLRGVS